MVCYLLSIIGTIGLLVDRAGVNAAEIVASVLKDILYKKPRSSTRPPEADDDS